MQLKKTVLSVASHLTSLPVNVQIANRLFAGCLAATLALSLVSVAEATPFHVVQKPPAPQSSQLTIDVDLGSTSTKLVTIGPLLFSDDPGLTATVTAPVTGPPWFLGSGSGELTFTGGELAVQNVPNTTLNLGFLGTVDISMNGVGFTMTSTAIPVVNNRWNIDTIGAPTMLDLGLNKGVITLDNPTGILTGVLTEPQTINLETDPIALTIDDLMGLGLKGTADTNSIGIVIPQIINVLADSPVTILAVLSGGIYLQAVPEPATVSMLGMGMLALTVLGLRFRRRKA